MNTLATQKEKHACIPIETNLLEKLEKSFALAAPITGKNQLLGSIIIFDKELRNGMSDFSVEDAAMLSAISVQASVAYNNTFYWIRFWNRNDLMITSWSRFIRA